MAVVDATRPYMVPHRRFPRLESGHARMLISTRFASVPQLHTVAGPGMARQQISFEAEPLAGWYAPNDGTLVVRKDKGGDEFFQLYTLKNGA
jgi:hypothetical protein